MHGKVYIFGIKVISRLIGLIYENIAKMANKIFNVPNHLNRRWRPRKKRNTHMTGQVWRGAAPNIKGTSKHDVLSQSSDVN